MEIINKSNNKYGLVPFNFPSLFSFHQLKISRLSCLDRTSNNSKNYSAVQQQQLFQTKLTLYLELKKVLRHRSAEMSQTPAVGEKPDLMERLVVEDVNRVFEVENLKPRGLVFCIIFDFWFGLLVVSPLIIASFRGAWKVFKSI